MEVAGLVMMMRVRACMQPAHSCSMLQAACGESKTRPSRGRAATMLAGLSMQAGLQGVALPTPTQPNPRTYPSFAGRIHQLACQPAHAPENGQGLIGKLAAYDLDDMGRQVHEGAPSWSSVVGAGAVGFLPAGAILLGDLRAMGQG